MTLHFRNLWYQSLWWLCHELEVLLGVPCHTWAVQCLGALCPPPQVRDVGGTAPPAAPCSLPTVHFSSCIAQGKGERGGGLLGCSSDSVQTYTYLCKCRFVQTLLL